MEGKLNNLLVVISGPSGSGKSETIKRILNERNDVKRISTYTTRKPRENEKNGEQYNFISIEEYLKLFDSNRLMACSRIENDYYGAPIINERLNEDGKKAILIDIGVSGGIEIKKIYPETIMIYLIPETEEQLLRQRGERGKTRQARAIKQIQNVLESNKYEWLVKNKDIKDTVKKVELIIDFVHKIKCNGLTDKEKKMYNKLLEEMSIYSQMNRTFLEQFYQIREEEIEK